jgi:hypothetical protein
MTYLSAVEPDKVGTYPAHAGAGGGYVWDEVLEYRVWCHPRDGAEDLALVLQREYLEEGQPGQFEHIKQPRLIEWPVEFLRRPRRDARTIPDFLSRDAPANRLEILRGQASRPD